MVFRLSRASVMRLRAKLVQDARGFNAPPGEHAMVNVRTVTYGGDPGSPIDGARMAEAGRVTRRVKDALQQAGYAVQTTRFASRPFGDLVPPEGVAGFARDLQTSCLANGFDFMTIGPARPADPPDCYRAIPDALAATSAAFASAIIADHQTGIDVGAVQRAADIVHRCARIGTDGFGNLRFAALANVPAGVPFLPAAYHDGGAPTIGLGIEGATAAVHACTEAASLDEARELLIARVEIESHRMTAAVEAALTGTAVRFVGIDFSLAPFPEAARSVGTAIERLTGGRTGEAGTLAAAAWLASTLDQASFPRVGFSGLFLPVFEDAVLAARAAEGVLTTTDLLLYSAVCGTGLDTVPLPGEIAVPELASVLMDIAALALRLDKPLTARLMPIPGRRAGDDVVFDFPYFAPSRVVSPRAGALGGLVSGAGRMAIQPRRQR
jgi:hypothetical protein